LPTFQGFGGFLLSRLTKDLEAPAGREAALLSTSRVRLKAHAWWAGCVGSSTAQQVGYP